MNTEILAQNETQTISKQAIIRYGWGNSELSTWFITKNKKAFLPKGSVLIFVITGEESNEQINTCDTYPKEGDIISDINGAHIRVNDVSWV